MSQLSPVRQLLLMVLLAGVYWTSANIGLKFAMPAALATLIWPPTGISLAALLIFGYRLWPGVLIGAFLAEIGTGIPVSASFIMPGKTVEKGVPRQSGGDVAVGMVEAARFAVLRFGGGRSAEHEEKAVATLKARLEAEKLTAKGSPLFAYYDPPWTPVFLRRNEVLIRLQKNTQ